uniref:protein FAM83E-like isoform X1 n=2 Tax=Myxine glutinosa TaxID=7769 RepID=UPI00358F489C
MDVFTDPDIFKDLLDASISRRVPVYLVLDERSAHLFGNICQDFGFTPNNLMNMRIRTVPGLTYCTRSGMKILGCVQEKYMLVDCNKVATGTYSYTWSDAKLHRSSITLLSGSVTEAYDKAFCILYAHSQPFSIDPSANIQQCSVSASPKHILPSQEPSKLGQTADNVKSPLLCHGCAGLKKVDHCLLETGTQTDSCPTAHKEAGKMTGMPSRPSGTRRSSTTLKQQQQLVGVANAGNGVARRRSSMWRSTNAIAGRIAKKRRTIEQSHKGQTKKVTSQAPPPGSPSEDATSKKGDLANVLPVSDLQQQGTKDAACSPFVGTRLNGGNSGLPRRGMASRPLNGAPLQQFMQRVWTERQASYNKVRSQLNGFLAQPLDSAGVGMRMRSGMGSPAMHLASRIGVHMRPALPSSHMPHVNNFSKRFETRFGKENGEIQLRDRLRVGRLVKK